MRSPIHPETLADLIAAADSPECQLELALMRAGVIAPVDLSILRTLLSHSPVTVDADVDANGDRRLRFSCAGTMIGVLHSDGVFHHVALVGPALSANYDRSPLSAA